MKIQRTIQYQRYNTIPAMQYNTTTIPANWIYVLHVHHDHVSTSHFRGCNLKICRRIRSNHWRCSVRKGVLRNFAKFTQNYLCQCLYWKWNPGTGVFLWILKNFLEYLFYRTTMGDCFWKILNKPPTMTTRKYNKIFSRDS